MSQEPRRRLRSLPTRRRVGEPNVLSNQATPNHLSTMGPAMRASSPTGAPTAAPPRSAPPRPGRTGEPQPPTRTRTPMGVPTQAPDDAAPARTRRLPSLSTLVFIAFAIFWAARAFGNAGFGTAEPTTAPAPGGGVGAGVVQFGDGLDDDCALTAVADRFVKGADVWWRAELAAEQPADAAVVVRAYRDEGQIDRREVPPDPEFGAWDVLCAGEPIPGYQTGAYRVEVWDDAEQELLATGSYTKYE